MKAICIENIGPVPFPVGHSVVLASQPDLGVMTVEAVYLTPGCPAEGILPAVKPTYRVKASGVFGGADGPAYAFESYSECTCFVCRKARECADPVQVAYVLRGLTELGRELFYTGKAGDRWVSDDKAKAFAYETLEAAQRKATMFNRTTELHGVRFTAVQR